MSIISKKNWESIESFLDAHPLRSTEVLADAEDSPPPGGETASDGGAADDVSDDAKPNEQDNEDSGTSDSDSSTNDGSSSGAPTGGDDFGGSADNSDGSGGGDSTASGSSPAAGGASGSQINPVENPFKSQNGKTLLDSKLSELLMAITDTLERIQESSAIDTVVVADLEDLLDSVKMIRETVYIQPIETSLYRYKLAVTSYEFISKELCTHISKVKTPNSNGEPKKDAVEDVQ